MDAVERAEDAGCHSLHGYKTQHEEDEWEVRSVKVGEGCSVVAEGRYRARIDEWREKGRGTVARDVGDDPFSSFDQYCTASPRTAVSCLTSADMPFSGVAFSSPNRDSHMSGPATPSYCACDRRMIKR